MNNKQKVFTGAAVAVAVATTTITANENNVHADSITTNNESTVTPTEQAQRDLSQKRDAVNNAQAEVNTAQNAVDKANTAQKEAKINYNDAQGALQKQQDTVNATRNKLTQDQVEAKKAESTIKAAEKNAVDLKNSMNNKEQIQNDVQQAKNNLAKVNAENSDQHFAKAVTRAHENLAKAKKEQKQAQIVNEQAQSALSQAKANLESVAQTTKPATQAEIDAAKVQASQAKKNKDAADKVVIDNQTAVTKAQAIVNEKQAAVDNIKVDWTTTDLINAPKGYKSFFGGNGLTDYLRQVRTNEHNSESGVQFVPAKYAGHYSDIKSLKPFAEGFYNSSANDGTQDIVFVYVKNNIVVVTDDVNEVPLDTEQPVTIWYRNLSRNVNDVSKEVVIPTGVYYEYQNDQGQMVYVGSWDDVPEAKKPVAIANYTTDYIYTNSDELMNKPISNATNMDSKIQQQLTEYAANVMNHFNETAGYPGRVVANDVAIQKANYVAQHQTDPINHETYASNVGADAENMVLNQVDPFNTDVNDVRQSIFNGIGQMLLPRIDEGDDWGHAARILKGGYMHPGTVNSPAKLGVSVDRFGNLHFLWFPATDPDFKDSKDFVSKANDTKGLQQDLANAKQALVSAQKNLKQAQAKQKQATLNLEDAQRQLSVAQSGLNMTNLQDKLNEAQAVANTAKIALDNANSQVIKAQQIVNNSQSKLDDWINRQQVAQKKVSDTQEILNAIKDADVITKAQQDVINAKNHFEYYNNLVSNDKVALTQANNELLVLQRKEKVSKDALNAAEANVLASQKALTDAKNKLFTVQNEFRQAKEHLQVLRDVHSVDVTEPLTVNQQASIIKDKAITPLQHDVIRYTEKEGTESTVHFEDHSPVNNVNKVVSQTNEHKLPQTGTKNDGSLLMLGLVSLATMFGLGFKKREY